MINRLYTARLATPRDLDAILGLREEAARWLAAQRLDQWSRPWPGAADQRERILSGITQQATWVFYDGTEVAATITLYRDDVGGIWEWQEDGRVRSLYFHRLIVGRAHKGQGLGALILDWAGELAAREGRRFLRADVWATNHRLHRYYLDQGFEAVGEIPEGLLKEREMTGYPSTALFQRPVVPAFDPRFSMIEDAPAIWDDLVWSR